MTQQSRKESSKFPDQGVIRNMTVQYSKFQGVVGASQVAISKCCLSDISKIFKAGESMGANDWTCSKCGKPCEILWKVEKL